MVRYHQMTLNKLQRIQDKTGYSLEEIKKMGSIEFFQKITGLMVKGVINKTQHDWLIAQRNGQDIQQIIDIFGGHEIK